MIPEDNEGLLIGVQHETVEEVELAARHTEMGRSLALRQNRIELEPQSHPDIDGENCVGCGDPIHPKRLAFKRIRCTRCQEDRDSLVKRGLAH